MATWGVRLLLGGVDCSGRLTGDLTIDAERGKARVCGFWWRPSGPTTRAELEGRTLTVDCHVGAGWVRRFTGRVLTAKQDRTTGVFYVLGQDTRKAQANGATLATILAWCAPDGCYAEPIFGARSSGLRQLEDVTATTLGTCECGADDVMRANPWAVKSTPDVTYVRYIKGTFFEGEINLDGLVNRWVLTLQWRYTRLWARTHTLSWSWGQDWCERVYPAETGMRYWQNPYGLPDTSEVLGVDGKAGWRIRGATQGAISGGDPVPFTRELLPGTAWYNCDRVGGGTDLFSDRFHWSITDQGQVDSLTSFGVKLERHGAQTVTRTYTLTLTSPASEARYGVRQAEDTASGADDYDAAGWEASAGSGVPAGLGYADNGIGDSYLDVVSEAAVTAAAACFMRSKRSVLRAAHRRPVSFEQPLALGVELDSTVRLAQPGHAALQAPVARLTDTLRFPAAANQHQGRATTRIELAVSRCDPDLDTDSALTCPGAPATLPTHTPHATSTVLGTHVGRWPGCPDWDDAAMIGWRTNRASLYPPDPDPPDPDPREYVEGFLFTLPDIEAEMTDEATGSTAATYTVAIPHDELSDGD